MTSKFRALIHEGLKRFAQSGPPSDAELQDWTMRLAREIDIALPTDAESQKLLRDVLSTVYARQIERGGIRKRVPEVLRYTIDRVEPTLRAELDRRIFAGADLIKINKEQRKAETLRRFAGWITSIPIGGRAKADIRQAASEILKPIKQVKFEARRVAIDQGHKLNAAVAHVVAMDSGAIAAIWHDRGEFDHGYDARPEHLKRSGKLFLVRSSWAMDGGLVKRGSAPYTDEIEQVAEFPFCSCTYEYISSPGRLPDELLTAKGRLWVKGGEKRLHDSVGPRGATLALAVANAAADVDPYPSLAKFEAGNYRKGHVRVQGIPIAIENARGSIRSGVAADGERWATIMPAHYGYVNRTRANDGDQLDIFIGPNPDSERVWVISQKYLETGEYDEDKVMLGFRTYREALRTYRNAFSDGRAKERIIGIREIGIDEFRRELAA